MVRPVCAVIGIGPGNGRSFARRFADEGYAVALLSRRTTYSEEVAADLEDARVFACDVSDAASIASAFASIHETMGPVQTVIYNVGLDCTGTDTCVTTSCTSGCGVTCHGAAACENACDVPVSCATSP